MEEALRRLLDEDATEAARRGILLPSDSQTGGHFLIDLEDEDAL